MSDSLIPLPPVVVMDAHIAAALQVATGCNPAVACEWTVKGFQVDVDAGTVLVSASVCTAAQDAAKNPPVPPAAPAQPDAPPVAAAPPSQPPVAPPTAPVMPQMPMADAPAAPVNLTIQGAWQGAAADVAKWWPRAGCTYNFYKYNLLLASGLTRPTYNILPTAWTALETYSVTAVDAQGRESLPSALAYALGSNNPADEPGYLPPPPVTPVAPRVEAQWNAGAPRLRVAWLGNVLDTWFTVLRDGLPYVDFITGLDFYDEAVRPGETHSYQVVANNVPWVTTVSSVPTAAVFGTAPASDPTPATPGVVQITGVVPDDDSCLYKFAAFPGALDYGAYNVLTPHVIKYSAGSLSIEMNGFDPAVGGDVVICALDKLGPTQIMTGPMDPAMPQAKNGQGDPSSLPNVLAASAPTAAQFKPLALTGGQQYLETFRDSKPLTLQPLPTVPGPAGTFYGIPEGYAEYANDKFAVRLYGNDLINSKVFVAENHIMLIGFCGGTPGTNDPLHENNATMVLMPKDTADISNGKVLHVSWQADPHNRGRHWMDYIDFPAGDVLWEPGKAADFPGHRFTPSGKAVRWEVQEQQHILAIFPGVQPDAFTDIVNITQEKDGSGPDSFDLCQRSGNYAQKVLDDRPGADKRAYAQGGTQDDYGTFNGTSGNIDKRHQYDLYRSNGRVQIYEQGVLIKDALLPVSPGYDLVQSAILFQVYHTALDRGEILSLAREDDRYLTTRAYSAEWHIDNLVIEVLDAFPVSGAA